MTGAAFTHLQSGPIDVHCSVPAAISYASLLAQPGAAVSSKRGDQTETD